MHIYKRLAASLAACIVYCVYILLQIPPSSRALRHMYGSACLSSQHRQIFPSVSPDHMLSDLPRKCLIINRMQ